MDKNNRIPAKDLLANALLDLLQRESYQKISVNELCQMAKVSRTTFYAHFEDKYALLSYCLEKESDYLYSSIEAYPPEEFFVVFLGHIQKKERFFYHVFEGELNLNLISMFFRFYSKYLSQILEEKVKSGYQLSGPMEAVVSYYVGGLSGMILHWLKTNCKMPKEELASCQYQLLKDIL